ncbi:MAG: type II toxin-antitoxin system RelE/ParE family toxin [Smithellaceae bacterium]|jgi:plasmid stabilization system protein ParE|nr:type II toxin-antitoxin system RelE/ParE family toxin [Smithellaceae bacterium]HBJ74361.1 plasmid stabilization protein [Syntrophaceae bacterium]
MKKVIFLPQAEQEMNEAAIFYDKHRQGLGREFLSMIKKGTDAISINPMSYPIQRNGIRRILIGRFPYGILYCDEKEQIVVIAVMHLHRAPEYWIHRVSEQAGEYR